jgi:hypothetical protein
MPAGDLLISKLDVECDVPCPVQTAKLNTARSDSEAKQSLRASISMKVWSSSGSTMVMLRRRRLLLLVFDARDSSLVDFGDAGQRADVFGVLSDHRF